MLSLSQGDWIVNRFGWCQPKPKTQVFDFLPVPLFFVVICFFYGITLIKYWLSNENSETGVSEKVCDECFLLLFLAIFFIFRLAFYLLVFRFFSPVYFVYFVYFFYLYFFIVILVMNICSSIRSHPRVHCRFVWEATWWRSS
jgi:hypothetical protein